MEIKIISIHKPARVTATAVAKVRTDYDVGYSVVLDAGLKALGESRESLFGYGITGYMPNDFIPARATVSVYAYRD